MASLAAAISLRPTARVLFNPRLPNLHRSTAAPLVTCVSRSSPPPKVDSDSESDDRDSPTSSGWGISSNTLTAGIGALGFVETAYLTYLKVTDSEAFCPTSGGGCSDVLTSDYSNVFGVPLPLIGMAAYGLVALLALRRTGKNVLSWLGDGEARVILLGATTSMATASAYFLYLLTTKLSGSSCAYCLMSAALSFSSFFITIKDFNLEEFRKLVGLELAIAGLVVAALTNTYTTVSSQSRGFDDIELKPFSSEITSVSTPFALSLAEHLHSIGAKMYGAFWCTHCNEQKEMFGREAMKVLDYVECFPDGVGKGKTMDWECLIAGVKGFPTWVINDKVLPGEQKLEDLAKTSGFVTEGSHPS